MQTENTMRYYYARIKMTNIKNSNHTPNVGEDAKKLGCSYTTGGNVKW